MIEYKGCNITIEQQQDNDKISYLWTVDDPEGGMITKGLHNHSVKEDAINEAKREVDIWC